MDKNLKLVDEDRVVSGGQIVLTLPPEWEGKTVHVEVEEPRPTEYVPGSRLPENMKWLEGIVGVWDGPAPSDESLRRENLY